MEILGKIFGSPARVKIMRLFLSNPDQGFENKDVSSKSKVTPATARKELALLKSVKMIRKKQFYKEVEVFVGRGKNKTKKTKKKRVTGWFLNKDFFYNEQLQHLLLDNRLLSHRELSRRFRNAGKIKLLVIAGVFIEADDSRLDLLIVGDNFNRNSLENSLRAIESEIGRELNYAVFDTQDFMYRLNMYDKLIRDVLDFPHEKVLDSLQLSTDSLKKQAENGIIDID